MTSPFQVQVNAVNRKIKEVLKTISGQAGKKSVPDFNKFTVTYTLNSSNALGTCRSVGGYHTINLNPKLLNELKGTYIDTVVVHEVCHALVAHNYGFAVGGKRVMPHGAEFKYYAAMAGISGKATTRIATGSKALQNSGRKTSRYPYHCDCSEHQLSTVRHNKIKKGHASYSCRKCRQPLVFGKMKIAS